MTLIPVESNLNDALSIEDMDVRHSIKAEQSIVFRYDKVDGHPLPSWWLAKDVQTYLLATGEGLAHWEPCTLEWDDSCIKFFIVPSNFTEAEQSVTNFMRGPI